MRAPNSYSLIGSKGTVLLVIIDPLSLVRAAQLLCIGKVSVLLVEIGFQELLYKGCSDGRDTVQAGRQAVQAFP